MITRNNLKFVASGVKKNTNQKNYQVQAVKKIYRHPLFEDGSMYHDIALIELETPYVTEPIYLLLTS